MPLLSPPPIAVLFRPLAAIPNEIGVYLWWIVTIVVLAAVILWMLRERPILVGLGVLALSIPIVYQIGVGNLNGLIVAGIVAAWYLLTRRRDLAAGAIFALMTAFKVTPAVFLWWLLTQRRWSAIKAFIATGLLTLVVSVLGAGLSAHFEYLGIVRQTATVGTTYLSLAGAARYIGLPLEIANALPTVAILVGGRGDLAAAGSARGGVRGGDPHDDRGLAVVQVTWFTILLGALAPFIWPMPSPDPAARQSGPAQAAWFEPRRGSLLRHSRPQR